MILRIEQIFQTIAIAILLSICTLHVHHQVEGFHLSFGHRIIKSVGGANTPQLNPASSLIRPIECRNAHNQSEAGICMFSIDCMQNKGVPLSICKHNYFVGTCCRLPDYNNFVGIVYDLRDTDANHVLEARKISPTPSTTTTTSTTTTSPSAATVTTSGSTQTSGHHHTEGASSLVSFPTIPATGSPPIVIAAAASGASGSPANISPVELEKSKYFISSTSLFSGPPTTVVYNPSSKIFHAQSQESARNADGSAPAQNNIQLNNQAGGQNGKLQIELDSFQIHQTTLALPQQQQYDLITSTTSSTNNNNNNNNTDPDNLEPVSTLNSAHSPPAAQQQFSTHFQQTKGSEVDKPLAVVREPAGSIYGLVGEPQADLSALKDNVVFANNHQLSQSTHRPPINNAQQTIDSKPTSDQEFSLSTRNVLDSETPAGRMDVQNATASPFVDLVSSVSLQTTTPFTTSLSTALIPNISSQDYQPAVSPLSESSISLVSSQPSSSSTTLPTTTTSKTSTTTTTTTTTTTKPFHQIIAQSTSTTTGRPSTIEAAFSLSQLYTSHQPYLGTGSPASASIGAKPNQVNILPSFHSMPSSKIVTSSSPSNNLIPGFSGLQSAILSHIPFKLASGLSSGLSNYLQAAMKPGSSNRPLISSNNAPAQHYQQNLLNSTAGVNKTQPVAIRFPGLSSTTIPTQTPTTSTSTSSPSSSSLGEPALLADRQNWQFAGNQQPSSSAPSILVNEVVREAQQVCGRPQVGPGDASSSNRKRVARIVGGNQSAFGQWPWMVSLRQWRKGAFLHKCGAALLNENWAITAAHCVENVKAPDLLLRLGEFDVSNQEEPYPYIERRVKSVVSHPSFDPKTFEYDLALLRFAEPIKFERNVIPVCVPNGNDSYVDRMATVIGWGRLYEDGPLPDIIQHVDVPIITNNECEKMYKNAGYVEEIPDMFICAGISKGGRDSCEGDSGGPLTMVDNDGRSYLVGIISWGIGCALPSQPGVYTRITAFSGWINQITSS